MPEAAVYKDKLAHLAEDNIGAAGQGSIMKPKTVAHRMD
jgi:hypothetical protein